MKDIIREKIIEKNYELLVHFNDKDKVRKIRDELLVLIELYLQNG